jgi:hypothetical protein
MRDSGSATPAMMVARMVRRKMNTTRIDQRDAQHQRELHVPDRRTDGVGGVVHHGELDTGRERALQPRQLALDALHGLDHVGAGLALDVDHDRVMAVCTRRRPCCSRARSSTSATS